jgi:hypothetical protein
MQWPYQIINSVISIYYMNETPEAGGAGKNLPPRPGKNELILE